MRWTLTSNSCSCTLKSVGCPQGKVLTRLCVFSEKILSWSPKSTSHMEDMNWVAMLAYLSDVLSYWTALCAGQKVPCLFGAQSSLLIQEKSWTCGVLVLNRAWRKCSQPWKMLLGGLQLEFGECFAEEILANQWVKKSILFPSDTLWWTEHARGRRPIWAETKLAHFWLSVETLPLQKGYKSADSFHLHLCECGFSALTIMPVKEIAGI